MSMPGGVHTHGVNFFSSPELCTKRDYVITHSVCMFSVYRSYIVGVDICIR